MSSTHTLPAPGVTSTLTETQNQRSVTTINMCGETTRPQDNFNLSSCRMVELYHGAPWLYKVELSHQSSHEPSVTLKLRKPKSDKKVNWKNGVVDNEHMGKKKSKCCCIYEKPRMFGESSSSDDSDDDDDCKMCRHQRKGNYEKPPPEGTEPEGTEGGSTA